MKREEFNWLVGRIMKEFRKNARMSQRYLADKVGMRQAAISDVEHGKRELRIWEYYRICEELNIDHDFLTKELGRRIR